MNSEQIWDFLAKVDPETVAARDTAANDDLIRKLFDGQWIAKYVRLYVWSSGRAAGLDDKTLLKLVSAYDNSAVQGAVSELTEDFETWYQDAISK